MDDTTQTGTRLPDSDAAWEAVAARDAGSDGRFVYAVASTGIYCRPSCPSRRPRRERVCFFPTPAEAEASGFRACLRCRPREAVAAADPRIERVLSHLDERLDETVTLSELGDLVGMSPFHLQRIFKRQTGVTPKAWVQARRAERFKEQLRQGESVTAALYEAGYGASSRLYEQSDARLGMTPSTYKNGGRGMRIRYTVVASPLGRLLVAGTERGVSAVMLGESDPALVAALGAEYPNATLEAGGAELSAWVEAIVASLRGAGGDLVRLPIDVQATAFERRVWRALQEIPPGATRSYAEVAAAIGAPRAVRAVANACAGNPVALVVPCHRVVRKDGASGGYRWGADRKALLLAGERQEG